MRHEYPKRNGSKLCRNIDTETQTLDVKLLESENIALASSMLFAIACHRPKQMTKYQQKWKVFFTVFFLIQFAVVDAFGDYCTGKFN